MTTRSHRFVVCALISLCGIAIPSAEALGENERDINQAIAEAHNRIRANINSLQISLTGTVRYAKGSFNQAVIATSRAGSLRNDVPPSDVSTSVVREWVIDFANNRSWSKGDTMVGETKVASDGEPYVDIFATVGESAFDGKTLTGLHRKELQDTRSVAASQPHPIEFYAIEDPAFEIDAAMYPLFMFAGFLPDGRAPLTSNDLRPPTTHRQWRLKQMVEQNEVAIAVVVGPPTTFGQYVEAGLRPDIDYRVAYLTQYDASGVQMHLEIDYAFQGSDVALRSWVVHGYNAKGNLSRQDTYTVTKFQVNPEIAASQFRLSPENGMVMSIHDADQSSHFEQAGRPDIRAITHSDITYTIQTRWWRSLLLGIASIVAIILIAGLAARRWKRHFS